MDLFSQLGKQTKLICAVRWRASISNYAAIMRRSNNCKIIIHFLYFSFSISLFLSFVVGAVICSFNKSSERQYSLRAPDALDEPIVLVDLDTSNGVMFPLYDPDTNMIFLCGKGDSVIRYFEVSAFSYAHMAWLYCTMCAVQPHSVQCDLLYL